jgi:hypothetical protein
MCWAEVETEPPAASVLEVLALVAGAQPFMRHSSSPGHGMVGPQGIFLQSRSRQTPVPGGQSVSILQGVPLVGAHIPSTQSSPAMHGLLAPHGCGAHIMLRHTPPAVVQSLDDMQGVPVVPVPPGALV